MKDAGFQINLHLTGLTACLPTVSCRLASESLLVPAVQEEPDCEYEFVKAQIKGQKQTSLVSRYQLQHPEDVTGRPG